MRSAWSKSPDHTRKELSQFPMPPTKAVSKHLSFLSMSPITSHVPWSEESPEPLSFANPIAMLNYVTLNWRDNFVTVDLCSRDLVEKFVKRPFFMLINVDAPLLVRYLRSQKYVVDDLFRPQ